MNKIYSLKYNQQHQLVAVSELCSRRKSRVSVNKKFSIKTVLPVNKISTIVSLLSVLMTTCCSGTVFASVTSSHFPYQTYRDFAENKGDFQVGALNVPIYDLSGNLRDHLDNTIPFPDFSSVDVQKAIATLISPQYAVGARHVSERGNLVFGNNSYGVVEKNEDPGPGFDEIAVFGRDFDIKRLSKLVTDVVPVPYYPGMGSEENFFANKEKFPLFYRVGSGNQSISPNPPEDFSNKTDIGGSYLWKTGGVIDVSHSHKIRILSTKAASLLPTLVQSGDSGSPLFAWDAQNKRWVVVGVTSLVYGSTTSWDHVFPDFTAEVIEKDRDPDVTFTPGKGPLLWTFNSADGTGSLKQQDSEFMTHGKNEHVVVPVAHEGFAPDLVARENTALNAAKNLSFRGNGGEIILQNDIDQGAGSLTFYDNYTVSAESSQSWVGAGIDVAKDVTVNWKVNGRNGDNLHKIGQGTLKIAAKGENPGGLRVGDGTVILSQQPDNDGKVQAFSNLSLVSGRSEVVLTDNRQVNPDNITWGFRGGKLDINGNDITFNKLYANALDYGSVITNASTRKATINLNIAPVKAPVVNDYINLQDLSRLKRGEAGDLYKMGFGYYVLKNNGFPTMPPANAGNEYWEYAGQNRGYAEDVANRIKSKYFDDKTKFIFSGKITGNSDVNIITKPQFSFIVDGDIDIADGTFQQQQGELVFQGHPVIHAYNNTIIADKVRALGDNSVKTQPVSFDQPDWELRQFSVKTLELTDATFRLARNATLQGDINARRAKIILGSPELYINKNDGDIEGNQDVIAGISVANTDDDESSYLGNVKLVDNSSLEIREKFVGGIQDSNNSTVTVFSEQAALTNYSQFTKKSSLTLNAGAQLTAYAGWNNDNAVTVTDGATLTLSANTLKPASAAVVPAYYVSRMITLQGNAVVKMAPGSYSSGYINDQGTSRIILGGGSLPDAGGFSTVYAGIVNASQGTMQVDNAHWLITGNSALKQIQGSNGLLSFNDATTTEKWFTDQVAKQDGGSGALADNPFPAVTASNPYSLQLDTLNTTGSTFAFRVNPYNGEHDQLTVNTMLSGENNRLQADYVGTDNGAITARQEYPVVSAPLSTAADHFILLQSGADGRAEESATGNQWRTGLAVLSGKIQRQWWLLNMNDTTPWRLTENRQFDLLSLPTKGRVELSQPDSGWTPRILQTDTLTASGVHFALTARPQSGESDRIIINKLASGGDNNLDLTLLMQPDTAVNDSSLLLATAPLATADSYFNPRFERKSERYSQPVRAGVLAGSG